MPMIEEGSIYLFSAGTVKMSNKRFTSVQHDFCLNFDGRALVEPVEAEDSAIKTSAFSFLKLSAIQQMSHNSR
jgi:ssDNA-binding replication factor A large subunit